MLNKKIDKLLIGTNNKGKIKEIKDLLPSYIKTLSTLDLKIKSPKEDGKTFKENSLIKSRYFSKKTKLICLSDDSGLEIDLIKKKPGIYSARWAGKKSDFKIAIKKVYEELEKKKVNWKNKIKCRFVCALTVYWPDKSFYQSQGIVEGTISKKPIGNNGFGYDPIFVPKGYKITFGEMLLSKKFKIDHRFKAYKKIKKFF